MVLKQEPAGGSGLPNLKSVKKLNEEELKKSLQRLYEHPCERRKQRIQQDMQEIDDNLKRNVCKPVRSKSPSDKDNQICERLYQQPIAMQKNLLASLEKKYLSGLDQGKPPPVRLTGEQSEETTHRLYSQSIEHKKVVREQSEKRVYGEAPPPRKLDNESLKENIANLYSKVAEAKLEKRAFLEDKYVWKTNTSKKITKSEVEGLVARLGTK